ncbi:MAG TPA: hypothetical protein VGZ00_08230 [Candidatus Baltobacteraceae bacterium]|jgi:plasmid stability protein|nr:hypothetical protein [Candidatus Baltobacteraceae bacterium]
MDASGGGKTTLTIRNFDVGLKEKPRIRSAHNGRSMESEPRHITNTALAGGNNNELNLADAIRRRFLPFGGVDNLIPHPPVLIGAPLSADGFNEIDRVEQPMAESTSAKVLP